MPKVLNGSGKDSCLLGGLTRCVSALAPASHWRDACLVCSQDTGGQLVETAASLVYGELHNIVLTTLELMSVRQVWSPSVLSGRTRVGPLMGQSGDDNVPK